MVKKKVKDKSMKDCKVCKIKITDFDPAFEDGVTTVLWAEKTKKGRSCRYCRKVHFKKHKKMPLKKLLETQK